MAGRGRLGGGWDDQDVQRVFPIVPKTNKTGADNFRLEKVRADVAALMGGATDEFALARNGTEALQNLIMQYGRLRPGDAVMYADLDYDEMQQAMTALRLSRGANVLTFAIPEPATTANILAAYERELNRAPANLKLLLVTHLSNRTRGFAWPSGRGSYFFHGFANRGSVRTSSSLKFFRNATRSFRSCGVSVKPFTKLLFSGLFEPSPAFGPLAIVRPPAS